MTTDPRRAAYDRDGYVACRGFLSTAAVAEIRANVGRYVGDVVPHLPAHEAFYEDKERPETLKALQRMFHHDAWFASLMASPPILDLAQTLLGSRPVARNMQWFNKSPARNEPTPPHQDGWYFMLTPPNALTMWIALEDVDEETGCVRYVPGSHRGPLRPHARTGVLGFSQGIVDYGPEDRAAEVPMPAGPGDLLAHHAMTIHRADGNASPTRTRMALGLIFYGEDAVEDRAAHEAYRTRLFAELAGQGRI